jgi:hypothetical protein
MDSDNNHPAAEAFLAQVKQLAEVAAEPGFGTDTRERNLEAERLVVEIRTELAVATSLLLKAAVKFPSCQLALAEHLLHTAETIADSGPEMEAIARAIRFLREGDNNG